MLTTPGQWSHVLATKFSSLGKILAPRTRAKIKTSSPDNLVAAGWGEKDQEEV